MGVFRELATGLVSKAVWIVAMIGAGFTVLAIGSYVGKFDFHPLTWGLVVLIALLGGLVLVFRDVVLDRDKLQAELEQARQMAGPTFLGIGGSGSPQVNVHHNLMQISGSRTSASGNEILLSDLVEYSQRGPAIQDQEFNGKDMIGPAILTLDDSNRFEGETVWMVSDIKDVFYDIDRDREIPGVIGVVRCTFRDCRFRNVGVLRDAPEPAPQLAGGAEEPTEPSP